ncbi:MAG TPA: diacylglycerol kinase [Candidatus Paceibacterota bacterium]|nr:diacylglycerol kinase [Candidatus Paceibacterota bacterium]
MKYWITRLSHPLRGLKHAFTHDDATQIEFAMGAIGLPIVYYFFDVTQSELLLLVFCWFFVMVTELQNTAMEIALTKIHPERSQEIGQAKDLASAAVVWASVFGLICLALVILN